MCLLLVHVTLREAPLEGAVPFLARGLTGSVRGAGEEATDFDTADSRTSTTPPSPVAGHGHVPTTQL